MLLVLTVNTRWLTAKAIQFFFTIFIFRLPLHFQLPSNDLVWEIRSTLATIIIIDTPTDCNIPKIKKHCGEYHHLN